MLEFLSQTSPKTIKTDVCIAGAGPAGISLALDLAKQGVRSVLLEGGGLKPGGKKNRDLYKGESTGIPYPLAVSRLRRFGGTSAAWGGWSKPLEPAAFGSRKNAILPSWPITPEDLAPYFDAALNWCEIESRDFDPANAVEDPARNLLFGPGMAFTQDLMRFSPPTRFGSRYLEDITNNTFVQCYCRANLVSLSHQADRIVSARAVNLDGDSMEIQAQHFILAMGGIEIARFLLHTRDDNDIPFGNASGLLGQCFMDQFGFSPGFIEAQADLRLYRHSSDDVPVQPMVTATADFQKEHDLPSACLMATEHSADVQFPASYFRNQGILSEDVTDSTRYRIQMMCEPGIHRESAITLSDKRDALGMQRLKLNWTLSDDDYQGAERFVELLGKELGANGLGRLQRTNYFEGVRRRKLSVTWHHNGTTRMSDSSKYGVVDTDCRVWGTSNLHVASSSVFPRSGYSNPTLTILALAGRLAEKLAKEA